MGLKQLKRDLRLEALKRLEEAARTDDDFKIVADMWDKLDENRERRERYHEISYEDESLKCIAAKTGDYLDVIFDSPDEMHQLVESADISNLIFALTDKQKYVLYLNAIKLLSIQQIAFETRKTKRNIDKIKTLLLSKIHTGLVPKLQERISDGRPITTSERKFLAEYQKKQKTQLDKKNND